MPDSFDVPIGDWCGRCAGRRSGGPVSAQVRKEVLRYFKAQDGYQRGDLITRDQVEPLLGPPARNGVCVAGDGNRFSATFSRPTGFLPQQFASPAGRSFMRQISSFPNAYRPADRRSRLPRGRQTIRDLIRGPDGYKMLQYMSTTQGGRQLAKMLSNSPGAGDFNKPTGRIATLAEDLLRRLKQSARPRRRLA